MHIGYSYAKIVSLPHELHVLDGDRGTVRCQNRSMDEQTFYSYVSNAMWWRRNTDGTTTRITTFGSAYSSGHTLIFNPFSSVNQGSYYCCLPDESTCSNISIVVQFSKFLANELACHSPCIIFNFSSSTQYQSIELKLYSSGWITGNNGVQYYCSGYANGNLWME